MQPHHNYMYKVSRQMPTLLSTLQCHHSRGPAQCPILLSSSWGKKQWAPKYRNGFGLCPVDGLGGQESICFSRCLTAEMRSRDQVSHSARSGAKCWGRAKSMCECSCERETHSTLFFGFLTVFHLATTPLKSDVQAAARKS